MASALPTTRSSAWPRFDSQPYVVKTFDKNSWTCWHVVLEFYHRELDVELPRYGIDLSAGVDAGSAIATAKASGQWLEIASQQELALARRENRWSDIAARTAFGDVVTFENDHHVGVIVGRLMMLHVRVNGPTRTERFDTRAWAPRLSGIYRRVT